MADPSPISLDKPAHWEAIRVAIDSQDMKISEALWIAHRLVTTSTSQMDPVTRSLVLSAFFAAILNES